MCCGRSGIAAGWLAAGRRSAAAAAQPVRPPIAISMRWLSSLRRLLGSELLVDALAGQDAPGVSQTARQLAEERRLFYVAITRARQRVIVTAVSGEEEQPSRFLDELDPLPDERTYGLIPRGVHLPSVVAELRAVVTDPGDPRGREAAAALAQLAAA